MKSTRRRYEFREDAIDWIKAMGFVYVDNEGWVHPTFHMRAIVEFSSHVRRPWVLSTYRSPTLAINITK